MESMLTKIREDVSRDPNKRYFEAEGKNSGLRGLRGLKLTLEGASGCEKKQRHIELVRSSPRLGRLTLRYASMKDIEDLLAAAPPADLKFLEIHGPVSGDPERVLALLSRFETLETLRLPLLDFLNIGAFVGTSKSLRKLVLVGSSDTGDFDPLAELVSFSFLTGLTERLLEARESFYRGLARNTSLKVLTLTGMCLPEAALPALTRALEQNRGLKALVLDTERTIMAIDALSKARPGLRVFPSLASYALSSCGVSE